MPNHVGDAQHLRNFTCAIYFENPAMRAVINRYYGNTTLIRRLQEVHAMKQSPSYRRFKALYNTSFQTRTPDLEKNINCSEKEWTPLIKRWKHVVCRDVALDLRATTQKGLVLSMNAMMRQNEVIGKNMTTNEWNRFLHSFYRKTNQ